MNYELMNYKVGYRTAPATPGLLKMFRIYVFFIIKKSFLLIRLHHRALYFAKFVKSDLFLFCNNRNTNSGRQETRDRIL